MSSWIGTASTAWDEYWIVDPDERTVEIWDLDGTADPVVHEGDDLLRWGVMGVTLSVDLPELFRTS